MTKIEGDLEYLNRKLTLVITNYCNSIGCEECPLKEYDEKDKEDCKALKLQRKILDIESTLNKNP